ncbi:hypothetical protein BU16DRAFT_584907 [Lophium mytilinum]|uniref:DUF7730 domain-containing protein n=1 Tax=Lophium mytilinum TaxID=390894 RepID=A0A6A6QJX2_9PEZI|nr:hypothetical protein BU16DRAFT_584907 [Lophium mytilinum]
MATVNFPFITPSTTAGKIGINILTICGALLCVPCQCYLAVARPLAEQRREKKRERDLEAAQHLFTPRARPVRERTLSLYNIESLQSSTEHQAQSSFLSKLPLELCLPIYEELLRGNMFHIWMDSEAGPPPTHRLRSEYCAENYHPNRGLKCFRSRKMSEGNFLSLLLTCRKMYTESVEVLYTANTFRPDDANSFLWMSNWILPQRFQAIRSLQLHYYVWSHTSWKDQVSVLPTKARNNPILHGKYRPGSSEDWTHVWIVIASMRGLRKLEVELTAASELKSIWLAQEVVMLEAVKAVTSPSNFLLTLPFAGSPHSHEMYPSLCQVVVPEEDRCVTITRLLAQRMRKRRRPGRERGQ